METKHIDGYIYSMWNGRFKVYKGVVHCHPRRDGLYTFSVNGMNKGFQCSPEEGVLFNAVIWFKDRNDNLARTILIDYQKRQIAKLQDTIDNYNAKIKVLEGGVVDGTVK